MITGMRNVTLAGVLPSGLVAMVGIWWANPQNWNMKHYKSA